MNKISELIKTKRIYFDGGLGTMLQKRGLKPGETPEIWNIEHPDIIEDIHRQYLSAGANIITTNTFGVNCLKYDNYEELIIAAIDCAKRAVADFEDAFIAFDIGPLGKFLEPIGDLKLEDAVEIFAKNVRAAKKCGVDLIIIETMNDSYETKAAVLAAKENSSLPVFVTNVYDENGKTLTGADPEAMIAMLEGLDVDAIGMNCSLGPERMLPLIKRFYDSASLPIIVNPNAGLPDNIDGKAVYSMTADSFAEYMILLARAGANILGGCCGTEPEYIKAVVAKTKDIPLNKVENKNITFASSYTHAVKIGDSPVLIGERINPTGKSKLKQALREHDLNYIAQQALDQTERGAHILDVNVGLPEIDEPQMMLDTVFALQAVCDTPIQLDSNDPVALEKAMRIYNGKPLINSVNGDDESMAAIFPSVKKYGGAVIALTLDRNGIPETPEQRIEIAKHIISVAEKYGVDKKDLIFDPLVMPISSNPNAARVTLDTLKMLSDMGLNTGLGISNISFGLPNRSVINSTFFAMALQNGLSCAIMNPNSKEMMDTYHSYRALSGIDTSFDDFISYSTNTERTEALYQSDTGISLKDAITKGLLDNALNATEALLKGSDPISIINNEIIPALNEVGAAFEAQKIFLPQLLMSAECSSRSFALIKQRMPAASHNGRSVIIATVKGDVHDIGKNIVKLLLESYGFSVFDLGKDVPSSKILDAVKKYDCKLVMLSALMTTTLPAMEETVTALHKYDSNIKVVVGGAVVTEEYARTINADAYGKDAMSAVRYAERFYKE